MNRLVFAALCACASISPPGVAAQQVVDSAFYPTVARPAFAPWSGPVILFDEGHNNGHAIDGSYRPFAELLRLDGYRVEHLTTTFTSEALAKSRVLIIINALASINVDNWRLPTPSAFTGEEIEVVRRWVLDGGGLLLVADHMPFPGAAAALAERLGFDFSNGFAIDTATWDPIVFRAGDSSLAPHPIGAGRNAAERIDSVVTFWGQAFRAGHPSVAPLLTYGSGVISYEPVVAWRFVEETPQVDVTGWLQAATRVLGSGRVVVLGEAGMLSAQLMGKNRRPAGMNAPNARQNQQFTLNVLHWLSGLF